MTDLADKIADWATPRRVLRVILYAVAAFLIAGGIHAMVMAP